jgi:probable selenium-dependent hydroxylase accessory protein YqeC
MNKAPKPSLALLDALAARSGLVCVIGAGGKKTTMYRLAALHPGKVGLTSTVYIPRFPRYLDAAVVVTEESETADKVAAASTRSRVVAFALHSDKRGRLTGLPGRRIAQIHQAAGFDVTYVKADGARSRGIKAPGDDEPQLPPQATTVIPIVSVRVVGEPLTDRIAHRVEQISALTGLAPGADITAECVARLLSHRSGALKNLGVDAKVIPLLTCVDDAEREAVAHEVASRALALTSRFDQVVLASYRRPEPLVSVVAKEGITIGRP